MRFWPTIAQRRQPSITWSALPFSLLKPYLRVFRGVSKFNLPGYVGFFQFLRNVRHRNAFEQAELILQAALDPAIANRARRGEFVRCFDPFDLVWSKYSKLFLWHSFTPQPRRPALASLSQQSHPLLIVRHT
jgi:hypothetical protein